MPKLFLPMRGYETKSARMICFLWQLFLPMRGYELTLRLVALDVIKLFLPMRGYEGLECFQCRPFLIVISPHEGL